MILVPQVYWSSTCRNDDSDDDDDGDEEKEIDDFHIVGQRPEQKKTQQEFPTFWDIASCARILIYLTYKRNNTDFL